MSQLSYIKRANRLGTAAGSTASALTADDEKEKNVNGVIGGIGYAAEKIGLGFLSSLEGLVDYTAGGIAKLLKNSDFAEEVFKNDWVNYNHADEWYNPSDGWKFVGDVTGGIGTSLPAIVASAGIVAASGGAAAPALVSGASSLVAGLGAAGNATKEAYYESGKLDGKAFGYGALSGATEAGLEYVSGALGAGSSAIARRFSEGTAKNLAKSAAAGVGKSVAKKASHSFAKQAIGDFMSEAFEEGMSEILAPIYKRMTYDPNAESATAGEVGYAALVGGLSGVLMGAGANALGSAANIASGASAVKNGSADSVIRISREISSDPDYSDTGYGLHEQIREHYAELEKSFEKTDGQVATLRQKLLVGALKRENAAAVMLPFIERSAENVVRSPELYAERFKSYDMRDMNGKPFDFSAEALTAGLDMSDMSTQAGRRRYLKSLRKSLTSDTALSRVAIAEATGTLVMDTRKMAESAMRGERIASGADFTYLAENGSREEIEALSRLFGTDDFGKLTRAEINAKIAELGENGALTEKAAQIRRMLLAESGDSAARPAPSRFAPSMENGVYRVDELFIIKESGLFYLYDRADRSISRALSAEKLNAALSEYRTRRAEMSGTQIRADGENAAKVENAPSGENENSEADPRGAYERLKAQNAAAARVAATVDGYSKLSAPNKREVRALIRSAQAHGLAEGDVVTLATVSARAGVKITLNESACLRRRGGKAFYVDGFYDGESGTITVNPKSARSTEALLCHELLHAVAAELGGTPKGARAYRKLVASAAAAMGEEECFRIASRYGDVGVSSPAVIFEEIAAHYGETIASPKLFRALFAERPSLGARIVSFFKGSASDYAAVSPLGGTARAFYKYFSRLARSFARINENSIAYFEPQLAGEARAESAAAESRTLEWLSQQGDDSAELVCAIEADEASANGSLEVQKTPAQNTKNDSVLGTGDSGDKVLTQTKADVDTNTKVSLSKVKVEKLKNDIVKLGALGIRLDANGKSIRILTNKFTQNKNIFSKKGRTMREVNARIKAIPHFAEILRNCTYYRTDTEIHGLENEAKKGVVAIHRFKGTYEGFEIEAVVCDNGAKQFLYEIKFIEKEKSPQQRLVDEATSTAPIGDVENNAIVTRSEKKVKPSGEKNSVSDEKASASRTASANKEKALAKTNAEVDTHTRFALVGKTEDGRGIYRTNYPKNTPKSQKQQDIIQLVQNVWSKKPIKLNLIVDGKEAPIEAWFNPKLTERSDLSKIAFGNRKGTASEKRITMNLSSDFYQIAEDSHYVGSKTELGKDNPAHFGVSKWHYFITNLVFVEEDGATVDCYLNIDVKQNDSGYWFYSFAIEKGSCPADVLSAVTDKSATTSTISITETTEKVNPSDEKNFTSDEKSSASRTASANKEKTLAKTNAEVDTHTRYAIKYPDFSETDISSNMDAIADMEAVAAIDASKLEKTGQSPLDIFNEYFASLGNNIASETFGDIALPKSSAKSEIRHGITAEKIASVEAIPAVIEQGKVIFSKAKEGGVERIVVCAPIKIGEADYYMGVMLQRDARYQRLYLHNVAIEREASSSSKDNLVTTGALENEDRLSITSIIQKAINVKVEKKINAKKAERNTGSPRMLEASNSSTKARHTAGALSDNIISKTAEKIKPFDEKASTSRTASDNVVLEEEPFTVPAHLLTTGAYKKDGDRLFTTSILQNALAVKKKKVESQAPREKSPAMNEMKRKAERFANKDRAERAAFDMPASRSLSPIKLDMSASERYELLKGRSVAVAAVADVARITAAVSNGGIDNSAFKQTPYGDRVKAFKNLGDELKVYKTYRNPDSGLAFSFSKGKMKECVSKQRFGYYDFAKLLSCLDSVIENAVEIEVHNRNEEGYKPDPSLIAVHVLVSAFSDGEYIVPVKLEFKELIYSQNSLHVAISLNKIKKSELAKRGSPSVVENKKVNGIFKQGTTEIGVAHCPPPFNSIIAQADEKVNSKNEKNNKNDEKVYANFGQSSSNRDFSHENGTSHSTAAEEIKKSELAKRGSPSVVENKKMNGIVKQGTTELGVAQYPPPFDSIIAQTEDKVNSNVEKNSKSYDDIFDDIVQNVAESDSWRQELSAFDDISGTWADSKSGGGKEDVALSELFARLDEHDERLRKYVPVAFFEKEKNGERYALTESFDEADNVPSSEKSEAPSRKRGLKGRAAAAYLATQIEFVNSQAGIEHAGRRLGVKNVEAFVQAARTSKNQAQEMLAGRQWTIMSERVVKSGDGFYRIIAPVMKKGGDYYAKFQSYLFHSHNVDRMSLSARSVERNEANKARLRDIQARRQAIRAELSVAEGKEVGARNAAADRVKALRAEERGLRRAARELKERIAAFAPEENKPVLSKRGKNGERVAVTAEESREAVRRYAELHPEFAEYAERVYTYLDNLQKLRLDAGLITEALYAELKEKYPHYVPTYRESVTPRAGAVRGAGNLAVNKTVSRATGGLGQLLSLEKSVSVMTESVIAAGNINRLIAKLYDAADSAKSSEFLVELSRRRLSSDDVAPEREKTVKKNQISFYRGGEEITLSVTPELYAGFRAFTAPSEFSSAPMRFLSASTSLFKKLVTSYNPFFLITNAVRDVMDAGINTKYSAAFPKNYVRAIYHLANNTEVAQLYRAVGGFNSSVFNYEDGIVARQSKMGFAVPNGKLAPVFAKMENLNSFIEQLPRFAEFLSSVEAGNSAAQALLDAAEVTTNFGRSGKITRALNKTVIPFLNPAVQGLSKIIRNTREAFSSVKAFASFSLKLALLGILPQLLNQLFYEGDDDYDILDDRTKENYFLFKVDDIFVRIPKGRVNSVVAGLVNRGARTAKGESVDWGDYVGNVISQITPVENFARPIWAPITDAINNTTWYGGTIESSRFEAVRPSERYDEATSSIAIRLGKLLNYSPKKLHYIIDQYSGIIGDIVLPLTTARAERNPFLSRFTTDPVTSNRLSDDFYVLYEEAQYSKAAGEEEAQYRLKYLSEVRAAASELYKEKRELQASELSDVDKLQQTRAVQALINELYKNAMVGYSEIESAIEKTQGMYDDESEARRRYAEIVRLSFGAEKALQAYSSSAYELASLLNRAGISFELLYDYYFAARDIKAGAVESVGSKSSGKRKKLVALVNSMPLTVEQKLLLIAMQGYSLKDGDVGGMSAERAESRLASYIARRGTLSAAERAKLRKRCGLSVA